MKNLFDMPLWVLLILWIQNQGRLHTGFASTSERWSEDDLQKANWFLTQVKLKLVIPKSKLVQILLRRVLEWVDREREALWKLRKSGVREIFLMKGGEK